ncbi:ankyrin repeat, SAM and basic leucine zipper domain-containing protein 1 [Bombina bombina]|uniref:ankyrin repeat, SAM and basic leucine zipper domain-containing protein 1 n=1 Tax=Bombina bombina TaxID=8345 RepID=UPI00235AD0CF|nr:ankyrin repeat, SAM and basic leucine zipper domain-containing protein 1 [Bombina bombina]
MVIDLPSGAGCFAAVETTGIYTGSSFTCCFYFGGIYMAVHSDDGDVGINVECCFQFGWTPLMYAASVAHLEMVRVLLDRGANASFEKDKFTVLMAACTAQSTEEKIVKCVELLLSRNADPNVACRRKMTPVMYAAREGHTQVVTLLVAKGADIDAQDEIGYTALTWAAHEARKNSVLKLLDLGADKTLSCKNGNTPAEIAKQRNNLEIYSILSFSANTNQGKLSMSKNEAIYKYLKMQPESSMNYTTCYSATTDIEVFLHGIGLEHLTDLFKDSDLTLRQLLCLEEEEFKKAGVTDVNDYKKLIAAVKEMQVEETNLEAFPTSLNLESSSEELLAFLLKMNRQFNCITQAVENINNQIPLNPEEVVLEWDSIQNFTSVCDDNLTSITDLHKEVCRLQNLLQQFQNGQKNKLCPVPPLDEQPGLKRRKLLKTIVMSVLVTGFIVSLVKLTWKKT